MILHGDCIDKLKELEPNSVDSIVTDPPYGLSFMGKKWDYDVPSVDIWKECYRVLKPGGYLLSFAGTRTQHRMAVNIEDAGFEIRDMIAWVYGSGFPKSLNIGKAVDKLQGNEREVVGERKQRANSENSEIKMNASSGDVEIVTKGNSEWEGWGTALKPALEPITVARKPLSEKNVAENVLKWGTGGINIDGSRVEVDDSEQASFAKEWDRFQSGSQEGNVGYVKQDGEYDLNQNRPQGRFPANLIHDGSDEVVSLFPESKSGSVKGTYGHKEGFAKGEVYQEYIGDSGSAARFFYCAKASKSDRDGGLDGFEDKPTEDSRKDGGKSVLLNKKDGSDRTMKNFHPTVKPTKLMQYLVKLVTPKGGTVLDPFMGSGSTGKACKLEGFDFIGIEREPEYVEIAKARINVIQQQALDII